MGSLGSDTDYDLVAGLYNGDTFNQLVSTATEWRSANKQLILLESKSTPSEKASRARAELNVARAKINAAIDRYNGIADKLNIAKGTIGMSTNIKTVVGLQGLGSWWDPSSWLYGASTITTDVVLAVMRLVGSALYELANLLRAAISGTFMAKSFVADFANSLQSAGDFISVDTPNTTTVSRPVFGAGSSARLDASKSPSQNTAKPSFVSFAPIALSPYGKLAPRKDNTGLIVLGAVVGVGAYFIWKRRGVKKGKR